MSASRLQKKSPLISSHREKDARRGSVQAQSLKSLIRSFNSKQSATQRRDSLPVVPRVSVQPKREFIAGSGSIEDYTIQHEIGKGGCATVFYSVYKPTGRQIAMKQYTHEHLVNPNRKKNLLREIQILKSLNHPNIIKLFDKIQTNDRTYIALEYVHSPSLKQYLNSRIRLGETEAKNIFKSVLEAVRYCHSVGVSHGDIKLENILLREDGQPVLIDFGFATCGDSKLNAFKGTLVYMAPEILTHKAYFGKNADVWALGVLLYTMVCGQYPFRGNSESEIRKKIERGVYSVPEFVSLSITRLIAKMLRVNPEKRCTLEQLIRETWIQEAEISVQ